MSLVSPCRHPARRVARRFPHAGGQPHIAEKFSFQNLQQNQSFDISEQGFSALPISLVSPLSSPLPDLRHDRGKKFLLLISGMSKQSKALAKS
jgi:hypothetical protein